MHFYLTVYFRTQRKVNRRHLILNKSTTFIQASQVSLTGGPLHPGSLPRPSITIDWQPLSTNIKIIRLMSGTNISHFVLYRYDFGFQVRFKFSQRRWNRIKILPDDKFRPLPSHHKSHEQLGYTCTEIFENVIINDILRQTPYDLLRNSRVHLLMCTVV